MSSYGWSFFFGWICGATLYVYILPWWEKRRKARITP